MDKPNFKEVTERLQSYSQNLNENSQLANSKLTLAFAEMINVMAWQEEMGALHGLMRACYYIWSRNLA